MASESNRSTKVGDAKYKVQAVGSFGSDKTAAIMNGGKGGGVKGGKTNEQMLKLGWGMAKAAANGKAY